MRKQRATRGPRGAPRPERRKSGRLRAPGGHPYPEARELRHRVAYLTSHRLRRITIGRERPRPARPRSCPYSFRYLPPASAHWAVRATGQSGCSGDICGCGGEYPQGPRRRFSEYGSSGGGSPVRPVLRGQRRRRGAHSVRRQPLRSSYARSERRPAPRATEGTSPSNAPNPLLTSGPFVGPGLVRRAAPAAPTIYRRERATEGPTEHSCCGRERRDPEPHPEARAGVKRAGIGPVLRVLSATTGLPPWGPER